MTDVVIIYFCVISLVAVILTITDKIKAKTGHWRIPENTLLFVGLIGGALFEFITMKIIHHKTRHKKFMIGLPVEIVLHIVLIILFLYILNS